MLAVRALNERDKEEAEKFARAHSLEFNPDKPGDFELHFDNGERVLRDLRGKKAIETRVDFVSGANLHRFKYGGGKSQAIAKAVGLSSHNKPQILDATAGLGKDAFVLASLGSEVQLVERNPLAFCLLEDGLQRAQQWLKEEESEQQDSETREALTATLKRMQLLAVQAVEYLQGLQPGQFNVVYLDPMFPEKKKSAQVKKDMQAFQALIGKDEDADNLLEPALNAAENRVVVKRPTHAPWLAGKEPSYQLKGKSSRFDVYALKKFD